MIANDTKVDYIKRNKLIEQLEDNVEKQNDR